MTTSTIDTGVQGAFEEHERAIRVPDDQNKEAKALHPRVREQVAEQLGIDYDDTFLSGSYRRKTQIGPLGDLDVIVVVGQVARVPPRAAPEEVLARVAAAARACTVVRRVKKVGVRAVTCVIEDSAIEVDLVPVLEHTDGDRLWLCRNKPEEGFSDWTLGHPRGQIRAAAAASASSEGVYIRLVRIAKSWNCLMGVGEEKLLPSYAIESAVHVALAGRPLDYADGLAETLALLERHLRRRLELPDPGDPACDVLEMLDEERRARAIPVVAEAARRAARALEAPEAEALMIWGELLGPTFPGPGQRPGAMAAALRAGTAGAKGAGLVIASPERAIATSSRAWRP